MWLAGALVLRCLGALVAAAALTAIDNLVFLAARVIYASLLVLLRDAIATLASSKALASQADR